MARLNPAARFATIAGLATLAIPCEGIASDVKNESIVGLWANPEQSVVVRTDETNSILSGRIIWANETAIADAREGGVMSLVGVQLLEDYHPDGPRKWKGIVYVPDMGRRFTSFISQTAPDKLKISGCILGGLICRSQVWKRKG